MLQYGQFFKDVAVHDQVLISSRVTRKMATETHGRGERGEGRGGEALPGTAVTLIRKTALFRATMLSFISSPLLLPWV
jgi:hypothetical protein